MALDPATSRLLLTQRPMDRKLASQLRTTFLTTPALRTAAALGSYDDGLIPERIRMDATNFIAAADSSRDGEIGAAELEAYMGALGFAPALDNPGRRGEFKEVARAGYEGFGFYGEHPLFHTAADVAGATSPALLEAAANAMLDACGVFWDGLEAARKGEEFELPEDAWGI